MVTIRVFLLDDQELVREGLRAVLAPEPDVELVGEAASGAEALAMIDSLRPDVVVMDLMAPPANGPEVCDQLRERHPELACLVLTACVTDEVLLATIRADVSGILLKTTSAGELVRSLRLVADGGKLIDPVLTGRLLERLRSGRVGDHHSAALSQLRPQERRLLEHLGDGLPNRQIAERMGLAEKTVKNYVSSLLRKLGMRSRTEVAVFVTNLRSGTSSRGEVAAPVR